MLWVTIIFLTLLVVVSCESGAFQCSNLQCVRSSDRCDGIRDCSDGTDETGCSKLFRGRGRHTKVIVDDVCVWLIS